MKKTYIPPRTICMIAETCLPLATSGDPTVKPGETEEQYSKGNSFFDDDDNWTNDEEQDD